MLRVLRNLSEKQEKEFPYKEGYYTGSGEVRIYTNAPFMTNQTSGYVDTWGVVVIFDSGEEFVFVRKGLPSNVFIKFNIAFSEHEPYEVPVYVDFRADSKNEIPEATYVFRGKITLEISHVVVDWIVTIHLS